MNNARHTPAPWQIRKINGRYYIKTPTGGDLGCGEIWATICRVYNMGEMEYADPPIEGQTEREQIALANLSLIASAPKLLEALESILPQFRELYQTFDPDGEIAAWGEWDLLAQTAIEDAKGEI